MATEITQGLPLGYEQVNAITNWIRNNISFENNNSDTQVSAIEVNNRKYGVCRDLAHLGIALCRSISIPSRIVVGYLYNLEPMDLHAWFEVYIGNYVANFSNGYWEHISGDYSYSISSYSMFFDTYSTSFSVAYYDYHYTDDCGTHTLHFHFLTSNN